MAGGRSKSGRYSTSPRPLRDHLTGKHRETCYTFSQREDGVQVTHHDTTDMSFESHHLIHTIMVEARRQGNKRVSVKDIILTLLDSPEVQRCLLDIGGDPAKVREAVAGLGDV